MFSVPVVLIIFKRKDTVLRVIDELRKVQPEKIYILGDAGRNEAEQNMVLECRNAVENAIDWDCNIIKHYAERNIGVYRNIGLGALWIFEQEKEAIFLEDDCLPDPTFFPYCEELLQRYRNDDRVFWICGTNYLKEYHNEKNESYMFTSALLPCGWASWSDKFTKYYDAEFKLYNKETIKRVRSDYHNQALYRQQMRSAESELEKRKLNGVPTSWDFQLILTLRANGLYGISPCGNLIRNIGADALSTHGGTSLANVMTRRFCEIPLVPMKFPMIHPAQVTRDEGYERKIDSIILYPLNMRIKFFIKRHLGNVVRAVFSLPKGLSVKNGFKQKYMRKYQR